MAVRGYRDQSSPAALVWAGGILLLALLSLGLVDHQSARQSRAQLAAVPTRPLVLVDLRANREARERDVHAELDAWREAASSLGLPGPVIHSIPSTARGSSRVFPARKGWNSVLQNSLPLILGAAIGLLLIGAGAFVARRQYGRAKVQAAALLAEARVDAEARHKEILVAAQEKAVAIAFDTVSAPKLAGLFDDSKEKAIAKRVMDKLLMEKA